MKLSSVMAINVLIEECEEKAIIDSADKEFLLWIAETLSNVVLSEAIETISSQ